MEAERKQILEMLREGKVTVEQAAGLLEALEASRPAAAPADSGQEAADEDHGARYSRLGRAIAERMQRHFAHGFGVTGAADHDEPQRANYSTAKLSRHTLDRMQDGTAYTNYGHLVVAGDAPEELLDRKIGDFTNFGHVEGPGGLISLLEQKCEANFGGFTEREGQPTSRGAAEEAPAESTPQPSGRDRRSEREREAELASYTEVGDLKELHIECHAGNLELVGTDGEALRLIVRRPAARGRALPENWEKDIPWSAERDDSRQTFTLGDPDNPDATSEMTFRLEIPCAVTVYARTRGGNIAAESLEGSLGLHTAGGNIEAREIEGELTASSGGGDVRATEVEGETKLDTGGGNVTASDIEGALTARTGGGDVSVSDIEGEVHASTGGGDVSVNDVEGLVEASAGGGDVSVKDVEGSVSAKTGGGNASVADVEGEVKAETGGGDVSIRDVEGSVIARTDGGDINIADVAGDATVACRGGNLHLSNVSGSVTTK
jgi:hypothetical protein